MIKIISQRYLFSKSQYTNSYINKDIKDISKLSYIKKRRAQKAICFLLSMVPHSVDEIADHFEISPELVKVLIEELTKANLVIKVPGYSTYTTFKSKITM